MTQKNLWARLLHLDMNMTIGNMKNPQVTLMEIISLILIAVLKALDL